MQDIVWFREAVAKYVVLVDTSALMSDGAEIFFYKYLSPYLLVSGRKCYIPHVVMKEIEKKASSPDKKKIAEKAKNIVEELIHNQVGEFRGEETDTHPDQVFRMVYAKFGVHKDLMFVTNDKVLARELCELHKSQSVKTRHKLLVIGVSPNGMPYKICENGIIRHPKRITSPGFSGLNIEDKLLNVSYIPKEGDEVITSSGNTVMLLEELARGGEGIVYKTNIDSKLVKIYDPSRLTKLRLKKLQSMSELKMVKSSTFSIAWPEELVYNKSGEFVGFLMKKISGKTLQELVFTPTNAQANGLSRADLVSICINLLKGFRYLHMKGVMVDDINPLNILIKVDKTVSVGFIDTDSFQIEGFKTDVGTLEFTRPSLLRQNVNFKEYKRQPIDEAFAVAVLIFRILMLGKHPFSYKGGEDIIENMKKGNFPYKLKDEDYNEEDVPVGPWRYIWSNILPSVRETLADALLERITIANIKDLVEYENKLIRALENYKNLIQIGKSRNELLLYHYYIPDNVPKVKVRCAVCGYEFEMYKDYYENKILAKNKQVLCGKHRLYNKYIQSNQKKVHTHKTQSKQAKVIATTSKSDNIIVRIWRWLFG